MINTKTQDFLKNVYNDLVAESTVTGKELVLMKINSKIESENDMPTAAFDTTETNRQFDDLYKKVDDLAFFISIGTDD